MQKSEFKQILPQDERYCGVFLNEVRVISDNQTLSLVLGSCISTVFVGKGEKYHLAANHIVIANPTNREGVAKKSAREQIDEIFYIFNEVYNISEENVRCLHLLGAGSTINTKMGSVPRKNIEETNRLLRERNIHAILNDTESYFIGNYSIKDTFLSAFVENRLDEINISFVVDLDLLFTKNLENYKNLPGSTLIPHSDGFEDLIRDDIIISISGSIDRHSIYR